MFVAVVTFNVEVSVFVTAIGFGEKLPPAPEGRPLTLKVTLLEMPEVPVDVTVKEVPALATTVRETCEMASEKLKIFNVTVFVCVMLPLAPTMVKV